MQKIIPSLWFKGNATEAVDFYLSVFPDGKIISTSLYPTEGLRDFQKDFAGKVLTISFEVFGQKFLAINAGPEFSFTEAISFCVLCKNQEEIDYYWDRLSQGGEESQCGWLKDKFGMSWQINLYNIEELSQNPKVFKNILGMKKIIIANLEK